MNDKYNIIIPFVDVKTCSNIAVIKYWGKRDETLILPNNSSLSITLKNMETVTKLYSIPKDSLEEQNEEYEDIHIMVNGKREKTSERVKRIIKLLRYYSSVPWKENMVKVESSNNFPTSAGLASSASGLSSLVFGLGKLWQVDFSKIDMSGVARMGSGSACRSMYGGFVKWNKGSSFDGSDSTSTQIADENHWKDLVGLVLVVSSEKKHIGSTEAMRISMKTSKLMKKRTEEYLSERIQTIQNAILQKDFQTFASIAIQDSDEFHEICLDSEPPIDYLNETSHKIQFIIKSLNSISNKFIAGYTFDAGPNAVVLVERSNLLLLLSLFLYYFPPSPPSSTSSLPESYLSSPLIEFIQSISSTHTISSIISLSETIRQEILKKEENKENEKGEKRQNVERMMFVEVGPGPTLKHFNFPL